MSVQSIYNNVAAANVNTVSKAPETKTEEKAVETTKNTGFDETAVVYEKSKETETVKTNKNNAVDREAIIAQMKADTEARMAQMQELVRKMMQGQGNALAQTDDIWSFLASGDYTVTEAAKLQAQEDISEDGYWGVEQTSQRILDFAKALSGNDVSKADMLLDAFKKGYKEATGAWGKELPEISKKTYEAVEEKFAAWKEEANKPAVEEVPAEDTKVEA
ncbi:MAG: hypothetical protein IJE49_04530 [Agathobacter sp.]|nr:hypothetical protein [Agathobacter sp.]